MSYTKPTYVDTKAQAILALASTIADEDKTLLGDGSVNKALDILADVLAEQDVQVPQTDAGAILALAQYASGMVKPEGTIEITENGEGIDVAQYATADVSVSGGGGETYTITVYELKGDTPVPSESKVYLAEWSQDKMGWSASATEASEAAGGTVICTDGDHTVAAVASSLDMASAILYPNDNRVSFFTMPAHAVYVVVINK